MARPVEPPILERPKIDLMGVGIDPVSEEETVAATLDHVERDRGGWVCPVNVDVLRQCTESDEVRSLVDRADLVVADGMPLLWASRLAGSPLPGRVAGSSLIRSLPRAAAQRRASVFLLGGNPGAAERAADVLRAESPGLRVAGTLCPPLGFERDPAELARIEAALRVARPDVVFVGLGFPKQERLIQRLRPVLPEGWFVSCGVSFSFVSGEVSRAPAWVQRAGLEWLHRLAHEPRRLFRRYVVDGVPFLTRVMASAALARRRRQVAYRAKSARRTSTHWRTS
jgi:N-acetylglucosaminyldiphosphoundecaprenol N-acetyl-beta-D-mannosaminyltransferase